MIDSAQLLKKYRDGLLHDVLPFWINHAVDHQFGGFLTSLDIDGSVIDTDKSVWQQGRFTWLLGKMYNTVEPNPRWLELALHGGQFLEKYCFDHSDGRMWFHLDQQGRPIRKRRYAFSEAFAAIAFGELAKATSKQHYADLARQCFLNFVNHRTTSTATSPYMRSKFTETRAMRGIGVPMITINTAQELRSSINMQDANDWIDQAIQMIQQYHVKEDIQCVMEIVGEHGELLDHFDGRTLNPGHAIEGAWFIMAEGRFRSDQSMIQLGCRMLDWMWERGWDQEYGGLLYFTSVDGRPIQEYWHDMKFWWPHNETIIATLMAYLASGDAKYANWHHQIDQWSYQHFPDPMHGEWFGYLHRDGTVSNRSKGNHWKGPFHLPRMQLTCWKLLESVTPTETHHHPTTNL